MGQVLRLDDLEEGGCSKAPLMPIGQPIGQPLSNPEKWLSVSELVELSNVSPQGVKKALSKRFWHDTDLMVRIVVVGRGGAGGKAPQAHVDSLPPFLRERWYAHHGIDLHEKVDPITGKTVMAAPKDSRTDPTFDKRMSVAIWRSDVIRPATDLPGGSAERAAMIDELAAIPRRFPNGVRKTVTKQTLYNWVRAYDEEGLYGLMRKKRTDSGAKRQTVSRAWDAFFAPHVNEVAQAQVADDLTTYIRSLWAAGERGWRAISEKSTTRLIEMSRDLRVVEFEALELGRCGDTGRAKTQFGLCHVSRRKVEGERSYGLIAIKEVATLTASGTRTTPPFRTSSHHRFCAVMTASCRARSSSGTFTLLT